MTLNNLILRLQSWNSDNFGVPLHCHCSQVHSDPKEVASDRIPSMGQIELWFGLVWSKALTIVDFLMPNQFLYI